MPFGEKLANQEYIKNEGKLKFQIFKLPGLHKIAPKLSYCLTGNFSPLYDIERVPQIKDENGKPVKFNQI
jgi:hypothetical protein